MGPNCVSKDPGLREYPQNPASGGRIGIAKTREERDADQGEEEHSVGVGESGEEADGEIDPVHVGAPTCRKTIGRAA